MAMLILLIYILFSKTHLFEFIWALTETKTHDQNFNEYNITGQLRVLLEHRGIPAIRFYVM